MYLHLNMAMIQRSQYIDATFLELWVVLHIRTADIIQGRFFFQEMWYLLV